MAQATSTNQLPTTAPNPPGKNKLGEELDINLPLATGAGFIIALAFYGISFPLQDTYWGELLWDRGPTQFPAVWGTAIVAYYCLAKIFKINQQFQHLAQVEYPSVPLSNPKSAAVEKFENDLTTLPGILARRGRRVLTVYMDSGDQESAADQAFDDSDLYSNTSTLSYSFPKILLTVIPLLGFIGTVLGIGGAVQGFTGVLGGSQNTEELVGALGDVTSGLGTAFDTTFLALTLSVPFLIFLTLVEQRESRLLKVIDREITEHLLPLLGQNKQEKTPLSEASFREGLEEAKEEIGTQIHSAVQVGFEEHLPNPEVLVEPAQRYAERAARALAEQFVAEVSTVQSTTSELMERLDELTETSAQQRQEFLNSLNEQQQQNQESLQNIIGQIQTSSNQLVEQMRQSGTEVSQGLETQAQQLTQQLAQAAEALNERVSSLQQYAAQVAEVERLQSALNQNLESLQTSGQLQETFQQLQNNLGELTPVLTQLKDLTDTAPQQREELLSAITAQREQQEQNQAQLQELVAEIRTTSTQLVAQVEASGSAVAQGLQAQAQQFTQQLEQAANALNQRVATLEQYAAQVSEVTQLQQTLNQTLDSFEKTAQLRETFTGLQNSMTDLKPVLEGLGELTRTAPEQRQEFLNSLAQQEEQNRTTLDNLAQALNNTSMRLVNEMRENTSAVSQGLQAQASQITQELAQAANALNQRVTSLEQYAGQVSEIQQLERSLNQTLESLSATQQLQNTFNELQTALNDLKPVLEKSQRPRRIRIVEEED